MSGIDPIASRAPADLESITAVAPRPAMRHTKVSATPTGGNAIARDPGTSTADPHPPTIISLPDVGVVFEVRQESGDLVVKIVDRQNQRIIREIPPEEVQRLQATMRALQGLLVDRKG